MPSLLGLIPSIAPWKVIWRRWMMAHCKTPVCMFLTGMKHVKIYWLSVQNHVLWSDTNDCQCSYYVQALYGKNYNFLNTSCSCCKFCAKMSSHFCGKCSFCWGCLGTFVENFVTKIFSYHLEIAMWCSVAALCVEVLTSVKVSCDYWRQQQCQHAVKWEKV